MTLPKKDSKLVIGLIIAGWAVIIFSFIVISYMDEKYFFSIMAYGQTSEEEKITNLENEVSELKTKIANDEYSWKFYTTILALIAAIIGIFFSNYFTRRSNQISRDSFESSKKVAEADLLLRLNESIYRSKEGKIIIECLRKKIPVLKNSNGPVNERDLENFLNEVETVLSFREQGSISSKMGEVAFSWVIDRIIEHKEIMEYIKKAQEKYGDVAWKPISDYQIKKQKNSDNPSTSHKEFSKTAI